MPPDRRPLDRPTTVWAGKARPSWPRPKQLWVFLHLASASLPLNEAAKAGVSSLGRVEAGMGRRPERQQDGAVEAISCSQSGERCSHPRPEQLKANMKSLGENLRLLEADIVAFSEMQSTRADGASGEKSEKIVLRCLRCSLLLARCWLQTSTAIKKVSSEASPHSVLTGVRNAKICSDLPTSRCQKQSASSSREEVPMVEETEARGRESEMHPLNDIEGFVALALNFLAGYHESKNPDDSKKIVKACAKFSKSLGKHIKTNPQ